MFKSLKKDLDGNPLNAQDKIILFWFFLPILTITTFILYGWWLGVASVILGATSTVLLWTIAIIINIVVAVWLAMVFFNRTEKLSCNIANFSSIESQISSMCAKYIMDKTLKNSFFAIGSYLEGAKYQKNTNRPDRVISTRFDGLGAWLSEEDKIIIDVYRDCKNKTSYYFDFKYLLIYYISNMRGLFKFVQYEGIGGYVLSREGKFLYNRMQELTNCEIVKEVNIYKMRDFYETSDSYSKENSMIILDNISLTNFIIKTPESQEEFKKKEAYSRWLDLEKPSESEKDIWDSVDKYFPLLEKWKATHI